MDGAWMIASAINLAYCCAKLQQPTGKALVVISQQEIVGNLFSQKADIPVLSPLLKQMHKLACISSSVGQNESFA